MELRREVSHRRRRTCAAVAFTWALALGVAGAEVRCDAPRSARVVEVAAHVMEAAAPAPPQVIAVPMAIPLALPALAPPPPAPAARAPRPACPPPRRDAPIVTPPAFDGDAFVDHVLPAPTNAGWVSMWSTTNLYVSYDAGASFAHVPGLEDTTIEDVAFDCYGHLVVATGEGLAIYDGAALAPIDLPRPISGAELTLVSGGPDVVVIHRDARAAITVSHDLGATWTTHAVGPELAGGRTYEARGEQAPDGTIRASLFAQRTVDGAFVHTYDVLDVRVERGRATVGDPREAPGTIERYGGRIELAASDHGVYARADGRGAWRLVEGIANERWLRSDIQFVRGPWPSVRVGDVIYAIRGDQARARAVMTLPAGELAPQAVDLAGRLWGVEYHGGSDCDGTAEPVLFGRVRSP